MGEHIKQVVKKRVMTLAIMVLLVTPVISAVASANTLPGIPTYPGSRIIDWPLYNAALEPIVAKRVVMEATGDQAEAANTQKFEEMLVSEGWHRGLMCGGGAGYEPWHVSGPFPWDHEWTATVDYNNMGNDTLYIVATIYTASKLPGQCEPGGDL